MSDYSSEEWESDDGGGPLEEVSSSAAAMVHPISSSKKQIKESQTITPSFSAALTKLHARRHPNESPLTSASVIALHQSKDAAKEAAERIRLYNKKLRKTASQNHARKKAIAHEKQLQNQALYASSNFQVKSFSQRLRLSQQQRKAAKQEQELEIERQDFNSRWYNTKPPRRLVPSAADDDCQKQEKAPPAPLSNDIIKQRVKAVAAVAKAKVESQVGSYVEGSYILKTNESQESVSTPGVPPPPWKPGPFYNQIEEMQSWQHPSRVFAR